MNTCFIGNWASARRSRSGIRTDNRGAASGELGYRSFSLGTSTARESGELGQSGIHAGAKPQDTRGGGERPYPRGFRTVCSIIH